MKVTWKWIWSKTCSSCGTSLSLHLKVNQKFLKDGVIYLMKTEWLALMWFHETFQTFPSFAFPTWRLQRWCLFFSCSRLQCCVVLLGGFLLTDKCNLMQCMISKVMRRTFLFLSTSAVYHSSHLQLEEERGNINTVSHWHTRTHS